MILSPMLSMTPTQLESAVYLLGVVLRKGFDLSGCSAIYVGTKDDADEVYIWSNLFPYTFNVTSEARKANPIMPEVTVVYGKFDGTNEEMVLGYKTLEDIQRWVSHTRLEEDL